MKMAFSPTRRPSLPIPIVSFFSRYPKTIIAPGARFLPSVSCREFYKFITQQGTLNKKKRKRDRKKISGVD